VNFRREVYYKEVNINLDMHNENVTFTYSIKLVALFKLNLWRNKARWKKYENLKNGFLEEKYI